MRTRNKLLNLTSSLDKKKAVITDSTSGKPVLKSEMLVERTAPIQSGHWLTRSGEELIGTVFKRKQKGSRPCREAGAWQSKSDDSFEIDQKKLKSQNNKQVVTIVKFSQI